MELGRELLDHWGYERVGELIWVKVGQTQRLIRTGRTGHWINHTKEHCLIGAKNANLEALSAIPDWAQVGLDSDVLVSEVRDTSRKPDEIYGIMERLAPGGKKLELFGRRHNARSGWLTVGNQLKSDQIVSTTETILDRTRADTTDFTSYSSTLRSRRVWRPIAREVKVRRRKLKSMIEARWSASADGTMYNRSDDDPWKAYPHRTHYYRPMS